MEKRSLFMGAALLSAGFISGTQFPFAAQKLQAAPVPVEGPADLSQGEKTVRGMAEYLENAPSGIVAATSAPARALAPAPNTPTTAVPVPDAGMARLEENEHAISSHYGQSEQAGMIRRFVALSMSDIDTEYQPDLSRNRLVNDLMKDAVGSSKEFLAAMNALPADAETERSALMKLAENLGSNEAALPQVEQAMFNEISRQSSGMTGAPDLGETRVTKLLDMYTVLVHDPARQMRFIQTGLSSQEDPRVREILQSRYDTLARAQQQQDQSQVAQPVQQQPVDQQTQQQDQSQQQQGADPQAQPVQQPVAQPEAVMPAVQPQGPPILLNADPSREQQQPSEQQPVVDQQQPQADAMAPAGQETQVQQ